ncbi:MAG: hypothetical protein JWN86_3194 [Planctomycetota bacterium]|nr:hypothetical protein [Planctomycetota bacterium]
MRVLGSWFMALLLVRGAFAADGGPRRPDHTAARQARALAAQIDSHLDARWAEAKLRPAAMAADGEFLRRASLDLVGKIPTAAEARDFLDDPDPGKRAALVDRLLESPAYAARAALLWRQLLLPDIEEAGQVAPGGLDAWLRKKIAEDAGYDRIVREILSARLGGGMDDMTSTPTPAAFYAARDGKPESLAGDTARAFLGLRVECAQCHNHPFAKWKREDFWGFAAFFAGVPQQPDAAVAATRAPREDADRRELTIPGTSTVVKAVHLDHSPPAWRPRAGTREVLAEWITAPQNPYFARAAVNRTWARLFGNGLIDPVDDLDSAGDPALVGLLDEVSGQFRDHGYDLKYLIRALMATRAYNLSSAVEAGTPTAPPLFARMPVRGLSPGQFVDSLGQATGADLGETRARFVELFAERDVPPTESQTSILQALTLMNGGFIHDATRPETGNVIGAIAEAPYLDTAGRVEIVFLAVLARRPKPPEVALAVKYIDRREGEADRARALSDVFWALLNGPEFRTNH